MNMARVQAFRRASRTRAARVGYDGPHFTDEELAATIGPCHYCAGEATSWDHVVPLSRKGPNTIDNIVPCCKPCNDRKGRRTPAEWMAGQSIPPETYDHIVPRYMTIPDVVEVLRIGRNTVYEMVASGEIPSVRFTTRTIRIPRQAFERWCAEREVHT